MHGPYQTKDQPPRKGLPFNETMRRKLHAKLDEQLDAGMQGGVFGEDGLTWSIQDGVVQDYEAQSSRRERLK